jgi:hypothetical protein
MAAASSPQVQFIADALATNIDFAALIAKQLVEKNPDLNVWTGTHSSGTHSSGTHSSGISTQVASTATGSSLPASPSTASCVQQPLPAAQVHSTDLQVVMAAMMAVVQVFATLSSSVQLQPALSSITSLLPDGPPPHVTSSVIAKDYGASSPVAPSVNPSHRLIDCISGHKSLAERMDVPMVVCNNISDLPMQIPDHLLNAVGRRWGPVVVFGLHDWHKHATWHQFLKICRRHMPSDQQPRYNNIYHVLLRMMIQCKCLSSLGRILSHHSLTAMHVLRCQSCVHMSYDTSIEGSCVLLYLALLSACQIGRMQTHPLVSSFVKMHPIVPSASCTLFR